MRPTATVLTLIGVLATAPGLGAQQTTTAGLELGALQRAAVARDARAAQRDLLGQSAALRLRGIDDALKPQFSLSAANTHQSDVTYLALKVPGASVPIPPKDRWSSALDVTQVLYDGGAASHRAAIERARLAEAIAGVDATLEPLRDEVSRVFFAAALLQSSERELTEMVRDLDAVLTDTRARVREGAALGRDSASVRAEWRSAQSRLAQARSARRAALATLGRLTGTVIGDSTPLLLPAWDERLRALDSAGDPAALRGRAEFARLDRSRDRLDQERALAGVENRPKVAAFADAGYGRPGLNQFKADPAGFWQAGVRVEWTPFTWGSAARSRELAVLQQRTLETEARALADQLARAVQGDLEERTRLRAQLQDDDEVIALRAQALAQGDAQRREGVITAAEAVALRSDLTEARLARERHRIELAQAEARIVTTLGLAPR
jgi:outer membrane protein TolC